MSDQPTASQLARLPLVCLGYHPWSTMWKRNQSMMAELARQQLVERLVFLNPEVSLVTSPWRIREECRTVRRYSWTGIVPRRPEPRTTVMTPVHVVPLRRRLPWLGALDRAAVRRSVDRALGGRRPYVLVINTVRPDSQELVDLLWDDAVLRVFDWSDDFARFPKDQRERRQIEQITERLIDRVDLTLAVNQTLAERAQGRRANVHTVINATNMRALPADWTPPAAVREFDETLDGPVLGYAGYINEHRVDLELVLELARRHPDWTILFIGPVFLGFEKCFAEFPNIRFHPPVPYTELQSYLALFDVCLIPHLDNAHTAGNNPLKLYDYLTTGRPVVATRIAGMEGFEDVAQVADSREGFIAAVEQAVADEAPEARQRRQARAAEHHWSLRAQQAARIIDGALATGTSPGNAAPGEGAAAASR